MKNKKKIFVIIGSASSQSANKKLIDIFSDFTKEFFILNIFNDLKRLPHFDPELSIDNPPADIVAFRSNIENADGVIICTPEYIFSIPSGLKNAIEWCVSTLVFSAKPLGLITASANGEKGHMELQLIMKTLMSEFNDDTTLLIQGIKSKIDRDGYFKDFKTKEDFENFVKYFRELIR